MGQCLTGCHRLPVAVQSRELGGPGSPTARCSHSPCLYCQHLPAGILGELVLETSPKPASGHLAPLGCADRPLKADRLHSGLLDVVLSFVNPHWPIPITYLLSCAQTLILDVFEDRHKVVLFPVPGGLPQLQPFKGSRLGLASSTSGAPPDLALGIQHSTLSIQIKMNRTGNQI